MTDKQIIIDGVDVSGCNWYTQGATGMICADWHISNDCAKNPNCYYKQLKRKEQECEMWKNLTVDNGAVALKYQQQLDQLKAENETYKKMLEDEEVILALNEVRTGERHLWFNNAEKYKQTLTEIKEIAEFDCSCGHNQMCICNVCDKFEQILQKISEVEPQTVDLGFWDKNGEYKEDIQIFDII